MTFEYERFEFADGNRFKSYKMVPSIKSNGMDYFY